MVIGKRRATAFVACALGLIAGVGSVANAADSAFPPTPGYERIHRSIVVGPYTKSVDIMAGETVQFTHITTGQSFVRYFPERSTYDLVALAPPGMFPESVKINAFAPTRLGYLGDPNIYNRVITIRPNTRTINVANGEIVKIVDAQTGNSFVWNFDWRWDWGKFELGAITPPGFLSSDHIVAYVQERPPSDGGSGNMRR